MQSAVFIRLRPRGPWRYGPGEGGQDRLDTLFRSDRLYSALTLALRQLGHLDEWLGATAHAAVPAVVCSSLFPFQGDTLFVTPPATLWPPPLSLVTTPSPVFLTKVRWKAARFVPLTLVESILTGQSILADQWIPDATSGCLLRRDRPSSSPYRVITRSAASVDRLTGKSDQARVSAAIEFEPGSGVWTVVRFGDEAARDTWTDRLHAAFRLLADTGFGGRRTSGWGQTGEPEFQPGHWPSVILPRLARSGYPSTGANGQPASHWLLSLYSPSPSDKVDWNEGSYGATVRGGHVDSSSPGAGAEKKRLRMIVEGSVLNAPAEPIGSAVDVAPEAFPHPVYRAGFALSIILPEIKVAAPAELEPEEQPEPEEMKEPESALREFPPEVAPLEEPPADEPAAAEPELSKPGNVEPEDPAVPAAPDEAEQPIDREEGGSYEI
jgi:CRISPR type III-A-associated RAMP protein Csm4